MPVDERKAYILSTSCYMTDGTKPELMNRGIKEQTAFKDMMKGIVELKPIDRLALDTRLR